MSRSEFPPVFRAPGGDACLGGLAAMQVPWGVAPRAPVQGMTRVAVGPAVKERAMTDDAQWFAGIDADGKMIGERAFAHGGAGLADLCAWLLSMTGAGS